MRNSEAGMGAGAGEDTQVSPGWSRKGAGPFRQGPEASVGQGGEPCGRGGVEKGESDRNRGWRGSRMLVRGVLSPLLRPLVCVRWESTEGLEQGSELP